MNRRLVLLMGAVTLLGGVPLNAQTPPQPPPLEAYGDLPGVEDIALSPDGQRLAIVARFAGARRLLVIQPEGKLLNTAELGTMKFHGLNWVGPDHVYVVTSATENLGMDFTADKAEFTGAIGVPATGGKPVPVYGTNPAMISAIYGQYGVRQIGGKWLGHFGGVELLRLSASMEHVFDHGRPALFSWDFAKAEKRKIAPSAGEGRWRTWRIDSTGKVAATLEVSYKSGDWEIINADGKTIAKGKDPTGDVGLIALGKDGTSVIYHTEDDAAGEVNWFEVPLAGGTPVEFLPDADIEHTFTDPMNGHILGYMPKGVARRPVLFDPGQQLVLRRVYRAFAKLNVGIMGWTPDFKFVLARTSGNGDAGTWYLVDMAQLKADPVGNERPRIRSEQVGPISTVPYRAADGMEMDGILTLPPGREAKNLPVVVMPHGGPHFHDEAAFDWWAQAMASRGYAVFQPNFRGSTNRDVAFRRAGYGQWGLKMQTDISDGLAELVKQGIADPKRACIVGGSFGGYAALAGVTLQQGLYRCAVAVAPVSDIKMMYQTDNRESGGNRMTMRSLRESLGEPKGFDAVSPRNFAAKADAPILMIHGKEDTVVPFRQSEVMADALKGAGKPHELITLKEEDHWLTRGATRLQMLQETMRFLKQHNPAD